MSHGGHGGAAGGHGGPGIGVGPGAHGPGPGVHGGGVLGAIGMHSGGPLGFAGRGSFSEGHSHQKTTANIASDQPVIKSSKRYQAQSQTPSQPSHSKSAQINSAPNCPTEQPRKPQPQRHKPRQAIPKRKLHPGAVRGTSKYLTKKSVFRTALVMSCLSMALGVSMCMANVLAVKLWHLGPIHLDGGILIFPLTYIVGDILVELYYRKTANLITFFCCGVNFVAFGLLRFTALLPATPEVTNIEPSLVLGISGRIMAASALTTILSTLVNNHIYDYMRRYESKNAVSKKAIKRRAWVSSFFAHIPDSMFFTLTAFNGMANIVELCYQAATSYLASILVETALLPLTGLIAFNLRKYLDEYLYSDTES